MALIQLYNDATAYARVAYPDAEPYFSESFIPDLANVFSDIESWRFWFFIPSNNISIFLVYIRDQEGYHLYNEGEPWLKIFRKFSETDDTNAINRLLQYFIDPKDIEVDFLPALESARTLVPETSIITCSLYAPILGDGYEDPFYRFVTPQYIDNDIRVSAVTAEPSFWEREVF